MKTVCKLILLSALLGLFSQSALADDGDCDILTDATPGLFGLCTAYCEAQSCDSYAPGEEPRSCNRLLSNYDRKKTDSDPDMPCLAEEVSCPCWGADELTNAGLLNPESCAFDNPDFDPNPAPDIAVYVPESPNFGIVIFNVDPFNGGGCSYNEATNDGIVSVGFSTTPEENAECRAQVLDLHEMDFGGSENCGTQW